MNRRRFLKGIGQSVLAGLFGAFVVTEGLGKFAEQKGKVRGKGAEEFVNQTMNSVLPDNLEWKRERHIYPLEHYNCKCVLEPLSPDYKLEDYFKEMKDWWIKNIALGMGFNREDIC